MFILKLEKFHSGLILKLRTCTVVEYAKIYMSGKMVKKKIKNFSKKVFRWKAEWPLEDTRGDMTFWKYEMWVQHHKINRRCHIFFLIHNPGAWKGLSSWGTGFKWGPYGLKVQWPLEVRQSLSCVTVTWIQHTQIDKIKLDADFLNKHIFLFLEPV